MGHKVCWGRENILYDAIMWKGFPSGSAVKNLPAVQETWVRSLGWEDTLEEGMATHFSIPAGKTQWTKKSGRLRSTGVQRVEHD